MGHIHLSSISLKKLITTKTMTLKNILVMHVNKGNDKIVIAQSTHNTFIDLITCSKAKLTTTLSAKQASESIRLHDKYQLFITLAVFG